MHARGRAKLNKKKLQFQMDRKSLKTNKQDEFGLRNMVCGLGHPQSPG
jgi:hypothetical protein